MASSLPATELTRMLKAWSTGDVSALEQLTPVVYNELRRLASLYLAGENERHVLQPSALVNEAFIRLIAGEPVDWNNRAHFFGVAARLMRQILIDFARAEETQKRGNRSPHVDILSIDPAAGTELSFVQLLDLDLALLELAKIDERQARVVELRYFGGLELSEVAVALDVSERTVSREWLTARAWLFDRLQPPTIE